jgi:DNA-directed RNA polymerase
MGDPQVQKLFKNILFSKQKQIHGHPLRLDDCTPMTVETSKKRGGHDDSLSIQLGTDHSTNVINEEKQSSSVKVGGTSFWIYYIQLDILENKIQKRYQMSNSRRNCIHSETSSLLQYLDVDDGRCTNQDEPQH